MYALSVPEDFRPEEFGWEFSNPVVPWQQREMAMRELHRFGFVSAQYARFQPPFRLRFVMTIAGYSAERRLYRVFYMRPFECPDEEVTRDILWDEIRFGYGRSGGSSGHLSVSRSEK